MNPNNQFSGNDTPQEPTNPSDTFGASAEESNALQQVENGSPDAASPTSQPMESPSPSPMRAPEPASEPTPMTTSPEAVPTDVPVAAPVEAQPKKSKKKAIIIIASILLVLGIATASVFAYDLLTPAEEAPTTTEGATVEEPAEEAATPVENAEQLDAEIDAIESDLNAIDNSEFSDETISDSTLQQ